MRLATKLPPARGQNTGGIVMPAPMDLTRIAIAAPSFVPRPVAPVYRLAPSLYGAMQAMGAAQVSPDGSGWSRSVDSRFEFGMNGKRVRTWLAALNARIAH